MRRIAVLGAIVLLTAGVLACGGGSLDDSTAETTDTVFIQDNEFEPRVAEVAAGTTVTWEWQGDLPHDVEGDGWASPVQHEGSFDYTFATTGSFDYECNVHPGMTGRVVVVTP
jgi:plastocyanin